MSDERRIDRMAGCACLGKSILGVAAAVLALYCVLNLHQCFFMTSGGLRVSRDQQMIKGLKVAIQSYDAEYHAFPISPFNKADDSQLRSRGLLIAELFPFEGAKLNFKKIHFIDLPMARNRKFGLWQDGSEWVLSDVWGEHYYIVLDTNADKQIANPEFGADRSDPKYADRCKLNPPLPTIQSSVLIYSSGPDRDPKTWHDNICSWR